MHGEILLAHRHQAFGFARKLRPNKNRGQQKHIGLALILGGRINPSRDSNTPGKQRRFDFPGGHGSTLVRVVPIKGTFRAVSIAAPAKRLEAVKAPSPVIDLGSNRCLENRDVSVSPNGNWRQNKGNHCSCRDIADKRRVMRSDATRRYVSKGLPRCSS